MHRTLTLLVPPPDLARRRSTRGRQAVTAELLALLALISLALLPLAGCGAKAGPAATAKAPQGQAERETKLVLVEALRSVRSGDSDDVLSLATESLLVLGPRPADAYGSRTDAVLALRELIDARRKPRLSGPGATVLAAPGGRSAYAVERLQLGRRPLWATALLDGHDGIWRIGVLQLSFPVSAGAAKKAGKKLRAPGLATPALDKAAGGVKNAAEAEDALRRALAAPAQLAAALEQADGLAIGTDGALTSGKRKLAALGKQLAERRYELTSDPMSVVTTDDALAFVACTANRMPPKGEPAPVLVGAVFRRTARGWELVVLHEAQAL